jgi:hypothetical protein
MKVSAPRRPAITAVTSLPDATDASTVAALRKAGATTTAELMTQLLGIR